MKIYKYELPKQKGVFRVAMERIQYTMHVQSVNNTPLMWAAVDEKEIHSHVIHVLYTGDDVPDMESVLRIGTAVMNNGMFVLHYYRETK